MVETVCLIVLPQCNYSPPECSLGTPARSEHQDPCVDQRNTTEIKLMGEQWWFPCHKTQGEKPCWASLRTEDLWAWSRSLSGSHSQHCSLENKLFLISNLNVPWSNVKLLPLTYHYYLAAEANPCLPQPLFRHSEREMKSPLCFLLPCWTIPVQAVLHINLRISHWSYINKIIMIKMLGFFLSQD